MHGFYFGITIWREHYSEYNSNLIIWKMLNSVANSFFFPHLIKKLVLSFGGTPYSLCSIQNSVSLEVDKAIPVTFKYVFYLFHWKVNVCQY